MAPETALVPETPFESKRVPLERRITLKFQHRDGFVNEYAANISLKGMFITAWVPEPPGSIFLFEVQVADQQLLIHGVGEVVWVREADEGPDRPAGMGIRFLKLDEDSRRVITEMVDHHVSRGGKPFDPAEPPEDALGVEDLFDAGGEEDPSLIGPDEDGGELATVVLDPRLHPPEGRVMRRRTSLGAIALWLTLAVLLGGSLLLVLLS